MQRFLYKYIYIYLPILNKYFHNCLCLPTEQLTRMMCECCELFFCIGVSNNTLLFSIYISYYYTNNIVLF